MSSPKRTALDPSIRRFPNRNQPQSPITWGKLFKAALGVGVATALSQLALFFAQLPQPLYQVSLVILALALLVALFAIRALWQWIRSFTMLRALKFATVLYAISVLVRAIAITGEGGFVEALFYASIQVPLTAVQWSSHGFTIISKYPSDFSRAYSSRNPNAGIDAVTANEDSSLTVQIPSLTAAAKDTITAGSLVILSPQAKSRCQLDVLTDESFFTSKDVLVTEGPRYEEDALWWRIRNEVGSAWCPMSTLNEP